MEGGSYLDSWEVGTNREHEITSNSIEKQSRIADVTDQTVQYYW
jgi:hypothetical protein